MAEGMRFTMVGKNMDFFSYDAITNVQDFNVAIELVLTYRFAWLNYDCRYEYNGSGTQEMKSYGLLWNYKKLDDGNEIYLFQLVDIECEVDKKKINDLIFTISFSDPSDKYHHGYPFSNGPDNELVILK